MGRKGIYMKQQETRKRGKEEYEELVNNKGKRKGERNNSRIGSELGGGEKADTRNKDEESCQALEGRIDSGWVCPSCVVVW